MDRTDSLSRVARLAGVVGRPHIHIVRCTSGVLVQPHEGLGTGFKDPECVELGMGNGRMCWFTADLRPSSAIARGRGVLCADADVVRSCWRAERVSYTGLKAQALDSHTSRRPVKAIVTG